MLKVIFSFVLMLTICSCSFMRGNNYEQQVKSPCVGGVLLEKTTSISRKEHPLIYSINPHKRYRTARCKIFLPSAIILKR